MNNYFEELEGEIIDRKTVKMMLKEHDASLNELVEDLGDKDEYDADDVIAWLGY